jgi:hypothetical protein
MDLRAALDAILRRITDLLSLSIDPTAGDGATALDGPDFEEQLATHRSGLFLGLFDEAWVRDALERDGLLAAIRARAGADVRVRVVPDEDLVRVFRTDRPEGADALLVELKAHVEEGGLLRAHAPRFPPSRLLVIDWLLMQDPGRPWPPGRCAFPGQRHPGLGVGERVVELLVRAARRLRAEAVVGIPQHYHNAVLYRRRFAFADPVAEGRFQALRRDLAALDLAAAAFAVAEGRVRDVTFDEPLRWSGEEMVLPIGEASRAYLADPRYADAAARTLAGTRFAVDVAARA